MNTQATSPLLVQFGAGNIGRSLVGQLFAGAGWRVIFVDAYAPVVEALNQRGTYTVVVKDKLAADEPDRITVSNVSGLLAQDSAGVAAAVAAADLVGTSVGANILPRIAASLAAGAVQRTRPLSVLLCENVRGGAALMRAELQKHLPAEFDMAGRLGFVETSIGKMVPIMPQAVRDRDPLEVWAEKYNRIIADADGFVGEPPQLEGLIVKRNFAAYVDRKLFIHNFGHAVAAYHGALHGKQMIWQCVDDPELRREVEQAMSTTAAALIRRYPAEFNEQNQHEHVQDLLGRFHNQALGDTVFRVGRDLSRKLGPDDRCIGALRLVVGENMDPQGVCRAIAAALHFRATDEHGCLDPQDAAFLAKLEATGITAVLREHSGLNQPGDAALLASIEQHYRSLAT